MPDFPTGLPDIPNGVAGNALSVGHTTESHTTSTNRMIANILALATKLGYGSSSPGGSPAVLKRSASGQSSWGTVDTAELAADAVTNVAWQNEASASDSSSTSYVDNDTMSYTSAGGDLLVLAFVSAYISSGTPASFWVSLRLDSGSDIDLVQQANLTVNPEPLAVARLFAGASSGGHTIAIRLALNAAGTVQTYYRTIIVVEFKR